MGSLGSDVLCVEQVIFLCSRSRLPLMFFPRPYLTICLFLISIDTRGVDESPQGARAPEVTWAEPR